ncbi:MULTISPECIES: DUF3737 family protein [unclassified Actinomyces]|nr:MULTISPECIES: DUF3737 family protein [unclassified Actinomyces]
MTLAATPAAPTDCLGNSDSMVDHQHLTGERALYASRDLTIVHSTFSDGESPLKESRGLRISDSVFEWKYPLWYCQDVSVTGGALLETARSGIWYTDDIRIEGTLVAAPKTFRRGRGISLQRVDLPHAEETLWSCREVTLAEVNATGDYFAKDAVGVTAERLRLTGNYAFDGARDVTVRDSVLLSKDAFWNCENVVVENSVIVGEYLGWNSRNVTLVDCTVQSLQGLCYIDGLTLRGCRLLDTTLAFEYCRGIDAEIIGHLDSLTNPYDGVIRVGSIGEKIFDPDRVKPAATRIETGWTPLVDA